jgi:hypothetical protein
LYTNLFFLSFFELIFVIGILYFDDSLYFMTKIPLIDDSPPEELKCTTCLLPMQYQTKKDGKFLWQCFKCGKQYLVSDSTSNVEESWSPPR